MLFKGNEMCLHILPVVHLWNCWDNIPPGLLYLLCRVSSFVRKGVELSAVNRLQNSTQVSMLCHNFRTTGGQSLQLIWSRPPKKHAQCGLQPVLSWYFCSPPTRLILKGILHASIFCIQALPYTVQVPFSYLGPPIPPQTALYCLSFDPDCSLCQTSHPLELFFFTLQLKFFFFALQLEWFYTTQVWSSHSLS